MNEVKVLPKGIPQGYKPQKQTVPDSGMVLISEWARKAAHELNDKHHNWIEARVKDEFADENLSEAQLRDALDHSALLMKWQLAEEYIPKVQRDYQMIEAYLAYLRANKGVIGRRQVTQQQWAAHRLSQMEELAYKGALLRALKARVTQAIDSVYGERKVETDLDAAGVALGIVKRLMEFHGREGLTKEMYDLFCNANHYVRRRYREEALAGRKSTDNELWVIEDKQP